MDVQHAPMPQSPLRLTGEGARPREDDRCECSLEEREELDEARLRDTRGTSMVDDPGALHSS